MLNLTARLAVRIQNFPDWEFNWSDLKPQRSRSTLTGNNFLPSAEGGLKLKEFAVSYMMEILANEFSVLSDLKQFIPTRTSPHPSTVSEIVPMQILFRDEKYKSENIEILSQLIKDANLQGDKQVQVYVHKRNSVHVA